ncbi:Sulfate transporter, CysZ-type [Marinobacterium lacunae]|uniref:Sulfate transporter CysZ n=1 Tax=Marinobacterium lacunae TaxID=1232683 RepID=A0A081FV70_9GAMM|nr:sulfate transporter CysZ [Marinobacterium lacunae]KEA62425.1 Sulfate transporter, CysZ-type [Marinobacterium lacunae]MBR9885507.1 sulfate transporter CysZ [Oceanospirillales bacterium]
MRGNPVRGAGYLGRGLAMLPQPGIRSFVLVPLLINILLFGGAIWLLMSQFGNWIDYLMQAWLPDWQWLDFLRYILWPLFALLVLVVVYYSFSIVANFIAAPFNGFLAEKVERQLRGDPLGNEGWAEVIKMVPRALHRELAKLLYYLPRVLLLLVLSFIPVINLAMPVVWFLFGAWMMAIQYCDYPMDNNKVSFANMKGLLKSHRFTAVGFGSLVQFGMLIPLLNLIIMPAAVVGATIYWVEEYAGDHGDERLVSVGRIANR